METKNLYKQYSREFKIAAVEMSQEPGRTVAQVARELEIGENELHTWRNLINENNDICKENLFRNPQVINIKINPHFPSLYLTGKTLRNMLWFMVNKNI